MVHKGYNQFLKKCGYHHVDATFKEHLCLQSTMIPLVYRKIHPFRIQSIRRIKPRFLMCKYVWIHWVQQKSFVYTAAILEKIFDLQMKIVIFQLRTNRKQHAAFSHYSRLASADLMLHYKRTSTSHCAGSYFERLSYSDLLAR